MPPKSSNKKTTPQDSQKSNAQQDTIVASIEADDKVIKKQKKKPKASKNSKEKRAAASKASNTSANAACQDAKDIIEATNRCNSRLTNDQRLELLAATTGPENLAWVRALHLFDQVNRPEWCDPENWAKVLAEKNTAASSDTST